MSDRAADLFVHLDRIAELDAPEREAALRQTSWILHAAADEIQRILQGLLDRPPELSKIQDVFLAAVLRQVLARQRGGAEGAEPLPLEGAVLKEAAAAYRHLGPPSAARPG